MLPRERRKEVRNLENNITIQDCVDLHKKFLAFADRAEQHSFIQLFQIDIMMEHSIKKWEETGVIDQGEAKTMFRVVNKFMEGEY